MLTFLKFIVPFDAAVFAVPLLIGPANFVLAFEFAIAAALGAFSAVAMIHLIKFGR